MSFLLKAYVRTAAVMLVVVGLVLLYTATGNEVLQQESEVLFELNNGTMLVLAGLFHLIVGGVLFFTRDLLNQGFQALWIGVNYIVYRGGMVWLKAASPFPMIKLVGWKLGVRAELLQGFWNLFTAYLVMGSLLCLMLGWRRLKQLQTEVYLKQWDEKKAQEAVPSVVVKK